MPEAGLRELKKNQTRQLIADSARELFREHGFDAVTVDDVARVAQVSKKTVFNYFPTKEDLVLHRAEEREQQLVAAVRDRAPGVTLVDAFRRVSLGRLNKLADQIDAHRLGGFHHLVESTPALQRRMHELNAQLVRAVAAALREQSGAPPTDPRADAVAEMLIGVQRALWHNLRADLQAGDDITDVGRRHRRRIEQVFALLADGLGNYPD
jgi:AcrR family transcriptional regulator